MFICCSSIIFYTCISTKEAEIKPEDTVITMRWFSGSFEQDEKEMKTGLAWALSYLGAELPTGSLDKAVQTKSNFTFEIDFSKVGFADEAVKAIAIIIDQIKSSSSYLEKGYIDLGRFVMLTLNSTNHYYQITRTPRDLTSFRNLYSFDNKSVRIINSGISKVGRLIEVANWTSINDIAYVSAEGRGNFSDGSFIKEEFEVMDFMPNGQLRFALYDTNGRLKAAADPLLTAAGKPAKCIWCHEINIQPFFTENPVLEGSDFLSEEEFLNIRNQQTNVVDAYRSTLTSDIDFTQKQDHLFMEQIYIDFMEPSAERVADEFDISLNEAKELLDGLPTHTHEEFGFPNLYDRQDIDKIYGTSILGVPESAREFSDNEPDFFR